MIRFRVARFFLLFVLLAASLAAVTEDQKLVASGDEERTEFGRSVSISGDTLAIGAPHRDVPVRSAGAVYIFERKRKRWRETALLTPTDPDISHVFGISVSLDGDTLAIGAPNDDDAAEDAGAVYVFERLGSGWTQAAKLLARDADPDDSLGFPVSLEGDILVAGADCDEDLGERAGAAYVFERVNGSWTETAKLTASDGEPFDHFGRPASISDGIIAIGMRPAWPATEPSSAYVFEKVGGAWQETARLTASGSVIDDGFGWSVALDGDLLAVGAPRYEVAGIPEAGAAWVFERVGSDWLERDLLIDSDPVELGNFGFEVAVEDASILVGVPIRTYAPVPPAPGPAPAPPYLDAIPYACRFERAGDDWIQEGILEASDGNHFSSFSRSLEMHRRTAVIGADQGDPLDDQIGAAYTFDLATGKLGQCISERIREFCAGLTGQARRDCVHEQQEYCRERYGKG